jgi:hypothetical protein
MMDPNGRGRFGVRTLKSVFGVAGAIVPILYCGSLLYYFVDVGGSMEGANMLGLGPTVLGLGAVSLLFCIPLILRLVRIFTAARSPGSGGRGGPDAPTPDDDTGGDADAAIARYMARQSAQTAPKAPAVRPAQQGGRPARPSGFGRRIS